MIVTAERVLLPGGRAVPGWVQVDGNSIAFVGTGEFSGTPDIDFGAGLLAPGLVDVHSHGGGGASFSDGPEAAHTVLDRHLAAGTTSMVASLVTASTAELIDQLGALTPLVDEGQLLGVHLEGPWLSPAHHGAHAPHLLAQPCAEHVDALVPPGQRTVRMVTLAPELPGALAAITALRERGVLAAIGHTDADAATARAAINAGATVATHLFNAMPPLHHRAPGPVGVFLDSPRVTVELIADTVHTAPEALGVAVRAARGGYVLVTDAMAAAGAGDGRFRLGGLDVDVVAGVARLTDSGSIAGSTLTLARAVATLVQAVDVPLADAVRAATEVPARLLGLRDRGVLAAGTRADLVHLKTDGTIDAVLARGTFRGPVPLGSATQSTPIPPPGRVPPIAS